MTVKDHRREFRLAASDDDLLVEAAGLAGVTVSEFVLNRALHEAEVIVNSHHIVTLPDDARARFIAALDAPLVRNERLAAQARSARRLKHVD